MEGLGLNMKHEEDPPINQNNQHNHQQDDYTKYEPIPKNLNNRRPLREFAAPGGQRQRFGYIAQGEKIIILNQP